MSFTSTRFQLLRSNFLLSDSTPSAEPAAFRSLPEVTCKELALGSSGSIDAEVATSHSE
jgi:hypothetical protein